MRLQGDAGHIDPRKAQAQANFQQAQKDSWLGRLATYMDDPQEGMRQHVMNQQMANFGDQLASQMVQGNQANQAMGMTQGGMMDSVPKAGVAPLNIPKGLANPDARRVLGKQQMKAENDAAKQEQREATDAEKKIREYMSKREGIAMDTQNKMDKLDAAYAGQGRDYSGLLRALDLQTQNPMGLAKAYSQGRMSEQDLMNLKNKLAMQQDKQYAGLTDDAANLQRMQMQEDQWAAQNRLREKLGLARLDAAGGKPLSGEMVKRSDNVTGMASAVGAMKELTSTGKDRPWATWLSQKTGISDTEFGIHLRNAAEYYGRMQSGGAIQKEEDKRFIASLFKPMDTPEIRRKKFKVLDRMIKERAQSLAAGRPTKSLPPALRNVLKEGGDVWEASQKYINESEIAPTYKASDFEGKSEAEISEMYQKFKGGN